MNVDTLRQRHPRLRYQSAAFQVNDTMLECRWQYLLEPNLSFSTTTKIQYLPSGFSDKVDRQVIQNMVNQLGLVELLSYWKLACSPEILIEVRGFSEAQLPFWQNLLQKGLSEFFFINKINGWHKDFVRWKVAAESVGAIDQVPHLLPPLVGIGGGKDSVVAAETLCHSDLPFTPFLINKSMNMMRVESKLNLGANIQVDRLLDAQLADLNRQDYLNGHTPFSAMVAFLGTLVAYVSNSSGIIVSNEWSANEGNTIFLGQVINHQYSKSVEFEFAFRDYCRTYLSTTVNYFSLLRPWHELQIAKVFAALPKYHDAFLSCNRGQKEGKWCGECPKCLFTWIILSPFLPETQLVAIFSQNLWQKESLLPIFQELTGIVEAKSFECVGTRAESQMAVALTLKQWEGGALPPLLQYAHQQFASQLTQLTQDAQELLRSWQNTHALDHQYERALRKWMTSL